MAGTSMYKEIPIELGLYDNGKVTIYVHQTWKNDSISCIYTEYDQGSGIIVCSKEEAVNPDKVLSYEAQCYGDYANVTL
jgi:hypothetical protein